MEDLPKFACVTITNVEVGTNTHKVMQVQIAAACMKIEKQSKSYIIEAGCNLASI